MHEEDSSTSLALSNGLFDGYYQIREYGVDILKSSQYLYQICAWAVEALGQQQVQEQSESLADERCMQNMREGSTHM